MCWNIRKCVKIESLRCHHHCCRCRRWFVLFAMPSLGWRWDSVVRASESARLQTYHTPRNDNEYLSTATISYVSSISVCSILSERSHCKCHTTRTRRQSRIRCEWPLRITWTFSLPRNPLIISLTVFFALYIITQSSSISLFRISLFYFYVFIFIWLFSSYFSFRLFFSTSRGAFFQWNAFSFSTFCRHF